MSPLASYLTPHWEGLILEEVASGGLQELGWDEEGRFSNSQPTMGPSPPRAAASSTQGGGLGGVLPPEKNFQAKN